MLKRLTLPFPLRYFSSRSASCCIPGKKARSQKTRVKTDTRTSSPVSLAATCHILSLQLPVETMTQIYIRERRSLGRVRRLLLWLLTAHQLTLVLERKAQSVIWEKNVYVLLCILESLTLFFSVDTTRVELQEVDPDVPGSDYINANCIIVSPMQGHSFKRRQKKAVVHNVAINGHGLCFIVDVNTSRSKI